jgi:hypothetical protein
LDIAMPLAPSRMTRAVSAVFAICTFISMQLDTCALLEPKVVVHFSSLLRTGMNCAIIETVPLAVYLVACMDRRQKLAPKSVPSVVSAANVASAISFAHSLHNPRPPLDCLHHSRRVFAVQNLFFSSIVQDSSKRPARVFLCNIAFAIFRLESAVLKVVPNAPIVKRRLCVVRLNLWNPSKILRSTRVVTV